jgi:hypothetical protein
MSDPGSAKTTDSEYADHKSSGSSFVREQDGSVTIRLDRCYVQLSEKEWIKTVAAVSAPGSTDEMLTAAAMVHRGSAEVKVDVLGETIAKVAIRIASGGLAVIRYEKPEIVRPALVKGR